ncbi:nuclear transport factor 2 family protein [Microvirga sp. ACRRW]|uniref:nuclear transport factor 2 family protein n=1 Tax=Microvirga sp. ACRRW TaxID=2918205 RepID=UPI001EF74210|nr:nuclear transport factor 2 family protein [Microvirga sp. ACRRW]MCG7394321.1 nuclear transport factor 2 family protein [Microvirga sp. ACRRW]
MNQNSSKVVERQLDAYNARDIDAFMACWAEDAQVFAFPDTLLAEGAQSIRERHIARFQEPNLHGKLISRMAVGTMVVDQEVVTRTFPEGSGTVEVIAIYEVEDGLIRKAWFKMGAPVLDKAA